MADLAQARYRASGKKAKSNRRLYLANREEHYERNRTRAIQNQYGLTRAEYDTLMEESCRICGEESKHLDHDHSTGAIRGPLCRNCNLGLGHFRDNPRLLDAAKRHLRGDHDE
jgi:hypothetical protein